MIRDWEARIPLYNPDNVSKLRVIVTIVEYLRQALDNFATYERQLSLPTWKPLTDDTKVGLKIWQRSTDLGLKAMKAQAIIDRPAHQIIKVIGDSNYRTDYDPVYDHSNYLMKVADQTFIVY